MELIELFEESTISLTANKVRTGLAMLGVIIGIASVIAMMGLGQASQKNVTDRISSLGTNLITIMPGFSSSGGVQGAMGSASSLDIEDANLIETSPSITTISEVSPYVSSNAQVIAGRNNTNSTVYGVVGNYADANNVEIESGSFITDRQSTSMSRVAVLGPSIAEDLFGEGVSPIGQTIRIDSQVFTVVGMTVEKGGIGRTSPDDSIYIPLNTAMKVVFGLDSLSGISVTAIDEKNADLATEQITNVLLKAHNIDNEEDADFRLFSQEDLLETVTEVTDTFTALLSGIAAISLIVGGIGIMNIMLVTVTERTREIGLRKALGAKNNIVIYQFLMEAVLITVIGGVIGIILGITASYVIIAKMSLSFTISYPSVFLAFGVSIIIGLIFGLYPAKKAADLLPIEALRYE